MKRPRFRFGLRTWFITITFVCVYVGGYLTLLEPRTIAISGLKYFEDGGGLKFEVIDGPLQVEENQEMSVSVVVSGYRETNYHRGGAVLTTVFWPLNRLDRWIRYDFWNDAATDVITGPEFDKQVFSMHQRIRSTQNGDNQ